MSEPIILTGRTDRIRMQGRAGRSGVLVLAFAGLCVLHAAVTDAAQKTGENPFPNAVPAPSLDGGTGWLNTSGEITMKDLRGKVVLIDFWTYCCINCIHVLPDLKYLEKKYAKELVVIGVHSAKFQNEKESDNIRNAIVRYEIEHPVINDSQMTVWRKFGARSWPTLILIDPEGKYCGYISGEGHREVLDKVVTRLVNFHKAKGTLDETPVRFDLEREKLKPTPLKYPGKVLADEAGNRLFISDSNHNRIVVTTLDGELIETIGSGAIGATNGTYDRAKFDHPQGMELVGQRLYVADTENHLIRVVDLKTKRVTTLAGTGKQSRVRTSGGKLRTTALNSPWDLEHVDGVLYIAMAGPHQLWSYKLGTGTVSVFAGTGREDITNGPLKQAALAQPSSISSDGTSLFVADSEGSSIRRVSLGRNGQVTTIAGASDLPNGRTLFEFGDLDGIGAEARLQHPLGTAYKDGIVYVADSYNHKIKKIGVKNQHVETWLGDGKPGAGVDPPQLSEPAGLSITADKLYIADTNNHRICVVDLKTGKPSVLAIGGLTRPGVKADAGDESLPIVRRATILKQQTIRPGESLSFTSELALLEGFKLNKQSPVKFRIKADGETPLIAQENLDKRHEATVDGNTIRVSLPLAAQSGSGMFDVTVSYVYCSDGVGGLCKLKTARWRVPIRLAADGDEAIQLATPPR